MSRDLLVLDFDGIVLKGAAVHVDRRGLVEARRHAVSTAATKEAALAEVLDALGRGPAACVVLSAEVVASLVRLPIASARGRSRDEIAQMLRWELEPVYAQQTVVPPVGAILEARRHLDRAQVEQVLARMRERRGAGDAASARFGAVARELGLVTDGQLEEALAIQERLGRAEEDHVCGWAVQPRRTDPSGGADWLAVGMPSACRRWWVEQLATRRRKLLAIYPRLPGAVAALDGRASATLVEVEPCGVARSVVRGGALVSLEVLPTTTADAAENACRELLAGTDPSETLVTGTLATPAWVAALGHTVKALEPPLRGDAPWAWAGIAAAARHAAGFGGPAAAVPPRDPGPPLQRRTWARWAAVIVLIAGLAAATDRLTARSLALAVRDLAEARQRLQQVSSEIRDVEQRGVEAGDLRTEIAALERERDESRARLRLLEEGVAARARLLPRLLDALALAVNDEILLDRTVEEGPGRIRVEGRAMSERAVQAFAQSIAERVLPLRLRVVDQAIRKGSSRAAGGSYSFGLLLTPLAEENP